MNLKRKRLVLAGTAFAAGAGLTISMPAIADKVTEEEISRQDLPAAVANTVQRELGGKAEEFEKISYEGMNVLYEAEYKRNGEEYEVYVFPNGQIAGRHSHEEGEE
jgi:hypothetical protein